RSDRRHRRSWPLPHPACRRPAPASAASGRRPCRAHGSDWRRTNILRTTGAANCRTLELGAGQAISGSGQYSHASLSAHQKIRERMPMTTSRPMRKMTPMVPPMNLSIDTSRTGVATWKPEGRLPGSRCRRSSADFWPRWGMLAPIDFGEPEIRSHSGEQEVQPNVVTVDRNQTERRVEQRDQPHDRQHAVNHGHGPGIHAGSEKGPIGQDAPNTEEEMEQVVEDVDGK